MSRHLRAVPAPAEDITVSPEWLAAHDDANYAAGYRHGWDDGFAAGQRAALDALRAALREGIADAVG